jgi:hypothetical protein
VVGAAGTTGVAGETFGAAGAEVEFVFAGAEALPFFAGAAGAVGAIVAGGVTEPAVADVTGTRFPFASVVVCWTGTAFASTTFATKSA